jgi:hypothetical protein
MKLFCVLAGIVAFGSAYATDFRTAVCGTDTLSRFRIFPSCAPNMHRTPPSCLPKSSGCGWSRAPQGLGI